MVTAAGILNPFMKRLEAMRNNHAEISKKIHESGKASMNTCFYVKISRIRNVSMYSAHK